MTGPATPSPASDAWTVPRPPPSPPWPPWHGRATDPLVPLTTLVPAWPGLALNVPSLPRALLPDRWIGTRAAKLFREQYARRLPPALPEWERISRP